MNELETGGVGFPTQPLLLEADRVSLLASTADAFREESGPTFAEGVDERFDAMA